MYERPRSSPQKRRRLFVDPDEEEARVERERSESAARLASTWQEIGDRYAQMEDAGEMDEVDLETGELLEDRGCLRNSPIKSIGDATLQMDCRQSDSDSDIVSTADEEDEMGGWNDAPSTIVPLQGPNRQERSLLHGLHARALRLQLDLAAKEDDASSLSSANLAVPSTASSDQTQMARSPSPLQSDGDLARYLDDSPTKFHFAPSLFEREESILLPTRSGTRSLPRIQSRRTRSLPLSQTTQTSTLSLCRSEDKQSDIVHISHQPDPDLLDTGQKAAHRSATDRPANTAGAGYETAEDEETVLSRNPTDHFFAKLSVWSSSPVNLST